MNPRSNKVFNINDTWLGSIYNKGSLLKRVIDIIRLGSSLTVGELASRVGFLIAKPAAEMTGHAITIELTSKLAEVVSLIANPIGWAAKMAVMKAVDFKLDEWWSALNDAQQNDMKIREAFAFLHIIKLEASRNAHIHTGNILGKLISFGESPNQLLPALPVKFLAEPLLPSASASPKQQLEDTVTETSPVTTELESNPVTSEPISIEAPITTANEDESLHAEAIVAAPPAAQLAPLASIQLRPVALAQEDLQPQRFAELDGLINHYCSTAPKRLHGFFAGQLPRHLFEIQNEWQKVKNDTSSVRDSMVGIIEHARALGAHHPILVAANKYNGLLTQERKYRASTTI